MNLGEILIMVLMLLFFMLLLTSVFSAFAGNEQQVVSLNAELLRSKMTVACALGKAQIDKLTFPQGSPYPTMAHYLVDVPGFLARGYTKVTGDPKYVLYYETFPIGEAVGWEVYHDFDYRIIAPFDYSKAGGSSLEQGDSIDFLSFEKALYKGTRTHTDNVMESAGKAGIQASTQPSGAQPVAVIANNIILTSELNPIPNEEPRPFSPGKTSRSGDWKEKTQDPGGNTIPLTGRDNTFAFSSYSLLTNLEKTSLKYRSCGKNYLCLKTSEGVERLPLPENCGNEKLQYIQLEYDNTQILKGTIAVGAGSVALFYGAKAIVARFTIGTIAKYILTHPKIAVLGGGALGVTVYAYLVKWFLGYKASDFYLASPCIAHNIEIEKVDCKQLCGRWLKYPLYDVVVDNRGERRYVYAGDHYQCVENIAGTESVSAEGPKGACLRVKVKGDPEGFCWTADPTKSILKGSMAADIKNIPGIPQAAVVQTAASLFGFTPVRDSTLYLQDAKAIALKPRQDVESIWNQMKELLDRRYWWAWPGNFGPRAETRPITNEEIEEYQLPI